MKAASIVTHRRTVNVTRDRPAKRDGCERYSSGVPGCRETLLRGRRRQPKVPFKRRWWPL